MQKNLAVGYFYNEPFQPVCEKWAHRIREVFFAWPGVLSCRPAPEFTPELKERLYLDLRFCRDKGILLDTLFNCNCYGDEAVSPTLADFVKSSMDAMGEQGVFPDVVTTTSPYIATVIRRCFPQVKIRGSVNLRIHGSLGFEYVDDLFDSFYVSRERQRDFNYMAECAEWAKKQGKELGMQLNSGCLRQCPFQQFHDNLHGHNRIRQSKIGERENFEIFRCKTIYSRKRFEEFIRATWIRPEDARLFDKYVSVMKIATRRIEKPAAIVEAYASEKFDGNLLELMDPVHAAAFAPLIIDNKAFPADWATSGIGGACADSCIKCGRCAKTLELVLKNRDGND